MILKNSLWNKNENAKIGNDVTVLLKKSATELNWFNTIVLKFYLWLSCDWNACNKMAKSKYAIPHE